jgi:hypothetical protein
LVTGTIVVAPGQPVLVVTITTPNSDSRTVTQGDNAVAFAASVTNVGAGNATNVTMFFSIEDEWNLTFGTLNISVDELNSGDTEVNTIEVSIPNTAPTGTFTVIANVTGKNSSTGTLLDPYNLTFEDTVSVLVESKTSTLGSAIESTGSSSSSSSGGGGVTTSGGGGGSSGGGGGSTIPTETVSSSETVRILRGTADSFPITITNLEPGTRLINVRIELDGFATQFLSVTPDSLSDIDFETSEDFLVNIEVPEYFTDEEYLLSATITGTYVSLDNSIAFTQKKLTEFRTIVLQVGKVEEEEIVVNFQLSQDFVQEMQEAGFPTFEVEDLFAQAEDAFEAGDLEKAQQLLDEISVSHETAFAANALLLQLEQDFLSAENDWLDVIEARETYELALAAFARGDFTTALERAKNAQLIFVLETRGRVNVFKFILDWWWLVLITLAISSLALYVAYKKILIFIIVQRMKYLNKEEQTIHDLLRDTQAEYLQTGTISEQQYHSFVDQYTERLTKIQQERIKLRSKRVALQKSNYEVKSLKKEQLGIHKLAKKDQINYFVKGSLTRARFIGRRDLNQERLMEIEREKTQVQEKKRNKKQGFFSMLLNVLHRISPLVLGKPKKSRKKSSRKLILQKGKTIFLVFILFFIGVAMLLSQYFNSSRELHFLSWALNLIPLLSSSLVSHLLNLGSALGDFFFSVFNTLWKRLFFFTLIFILSAGYVILFSRALRKNLKKILGVLVVVLAIIVLAYQPGVTGAFSLVNVAPQGFSYSIEEEATEGEAMAALTKAEVTILRIAELNVSTRFAEDLYSEAQLAYESGNYTHTIVAMLVVDYLHQDILELIDQVAIYKIQYAETKDFDLTEAYIKLQEAEEALALARHDEARELLEQSYTAFVVASEEKSRVENLVQLSRSFFVRYWWQILLAVAAISISLVPIMKRVRKKIIARKLKDLRLELVHTKSMIKKLQNDCFIRKKITPMQYKAAAKKYSHRIGELKHIIPAMENQLLERKRKRVLQKGVIEIK